MELTKEQLIEIEEMAAAFMPPDEIAILVHIDPASRDRFCEICRSHKTSELYNAYQRGKLKTKFELRKTVVKLAKAGSPAAEPLADKYLLEQLAKE